MLGIFASGGAGTDVNMFFDLIFAMSLMIGTIEPRRYPSAQFTALILFAAIGGSIRLPEALDHKNIRVEEIATEEAIAQIKNSSDPVLCENLLLCYWAGKPLNYDPFMAQQIFLLHPEKEIEFLKTMKEHPFSLVQIDHLPGKNTPDFSRFAPAMAKELQSQWKIEFTNKIVFFLTKKYSSL